MTIPRRGSLGTPLPRAEPMLPGVCPPPDPREVKTGTTDVHDS